jgi:integrative and conjugative element protein (TIGR02256 family)
MPGLWRLPVNLVYVIEPGGPSVVLSDAVVAAMLRYRQTSIMDKEAGGQLFAVFEGGDTIVVEATPPKPHDKRARFGFMPNRWFQNMEIKTNHKQGKHFVGDWHTHPQPVPVPSGDDIKSMVDCFKKSRHELKAFLMVIVGTAEPSKGLFVCLVTDKSISKLTLRWPGLVRQPEG